MAPGFGSGLAHALTAGVTGYGQGEEENRRALIVLAAQRRAEARQKQQDEIARIGALTAAANAGMDVTPADTGRVAPAGAPTGAPTPAPDAGPSGTTLGTINGMQVRVPAGGVVGKAARDDAAKQSQRTADLARRAQPLNAKLPAGHPYKLADEQLASIAADPTLYNEWAKGALGIGVERNPVVGSDAWMKAERFKASLIPRPEPVVIQSGVDPSTGQMHVYRIPKNAGDAQEIGGIAPTPNTGGGMSGMGATQIRKAIAENRTQLATINEAIRELEANPSATGLSRGTGMIPGLGEVAGQVNQRMDPKGEKARNALQNATSLTIVNRSGKAVTKTEMASLGFLPNVASTADANVGKLRDLRKYVETETANLEQQAAQSPRSAGASLQGGAPAQKRTGGRTYTYGGVTYHVP